MEFSLPDSDSGGEIIDNEVEVMDDRECCNEVHVEVRAEKRGRQDSSEDDKQSNDEEFKKVERKNRKSKVAKMGEVRTENNNYMQHALDGLQKYVVVITSKEVLPKQFGLAKLLRAENIQNILKITYKSLYRVFVEFEKRDEADVLLNNRNLTASFRCQMADEINMVYGILRQVDLDITEEEALANLKCEYDITAIKRLKRIGVDGKWVDSESIRLSIKGSTFPPYVFGYGCRFKVEPYTFPVSQCSVCWRYGHMARTCPANKPVCPKCTGNHQCCETDKFVCVNCKGQHMALYKGCPIFLKEKELRKIMSTEQCTYKKAISLFNSRRETEHKEHSVDRGESLNRRVEEFPLLPRSSMNTEEPVDTASYKKALLSKSQVHSKDTESDDEERKKGNSDNMSKKATKKNKNQNQAEEAYFEISEPVLCMTDDMRAEGCEDSGIGATARANTCQKGSWSFIWKLLKNVENILMSENSFEEKLKSIFKNILKECIELLMNVTGSENLLSRMLNFISNYGI